MFKLIIGLGNPGNRFLGTRHNLGFEAVEALAREFMVHSSWFMEEELRCQVMKISELPTMNQSLILAKPQTYMNKSGLAVAALSRFYKIPSTDIIIIHDDLDLLLGHMKVRIGGSDAGHHGLESIIKELGIDQFIRVRLGIGAEKTLSGEHKKVFFNAEHFVMEPFLPKERSKARALIKRTVKAVGVILEKGIATAQNQFN